MLGKGVLVVNTSIGLWSHSGRPLSLPSALPLEPVNNSHEQPVAVIRATTAAVAEQIAIAGNRLPR